MRHDLIGLDRRRDWNSVLDGVAHGYWHGWTPCKASSLSTGWPGFLYVGEWEGGRVVCPIARRDWEGRPDAVTPIGYSGFASSSGALPAGFADEWQAFMRTHGFVCAYVAQHPLVAPPWPGDGQFEGNMLYILDLAQPPQEWLSRVDANRRRSIRAWERQGAPWVRDRQRLTAFLVENHAAFMRTAGAAQASFHSDDAIAMFCADPAVELVGACDEAGVCAAAAFGAGTGVAELIFHVSVRSGRSYGPALMWWAVQHFHERKLDHLNLGGGIRPGDSLSHAKLRYRPRQMMFSALKQVFDEDAYQRLCAQAGCDGQDKSGYFPPYRAPRRSAEPAA